MAISGNSTLDTAYSDSISDFDAMAADLQSAATEEDAIVAGGANSEYALASEILASTEFKWLQNKINEMRKESSASSSSKFFER